MSKKDIMEREKREPETIICDRMGWYHDAYYCDQHAGCPYASDDVEGNVACYEKQFKHCPIYEDD